MKVKYYCNPEYTGDCPFRRAADRRCLWEGRCNQQLVGYYDPFKRKIVLLNRKLKILREIMEEIE